MIPTDWQVLLMNNRNPSLLEWAIIAIVILGVLYVVRPYLKRWLLR